MKKRLTKLPSLMESLQSHSVSENFNYRGHKIKVSPYSGGFSYEVSSLIEGQPSLHSASGFANEEVATKSAQAFIDDYQQNFVSSEHSIVSQQNKSVHTPSSSSFY